MKVGDYCINPFVGGGIICRCISQSELFCLKSKEIIKAELYMMKPIPLSFFLNVKKMSYMQRMQNIICIEIIDVGIGIMEKSKWNDFNKNLENMIASNDFSKLSISFNDFPKLTAESEQNIGLNIGCQPMLGRGKSSG